MYEPIRQTAVKDAIRNLCQRQNISLFAIKEGQATAKTVLKNQGSASRAVRLGMKASKHSNSIYIEA